MDDGYYVACKPITRSSFIYINWNELLFIVILMWFLQWSDETIYVVVENTQSSVKQNL